MKRPFRNRIITLLTMAAVSFGCYSCISTDATLGSDFIATDQLFDTYVAEIPIEDIDMLMADSLSGFSQRKVAIGSIRDENGLSSRSCAIPLVPLYDSLDFGKNAEFKGFHFSLLRDTVNVNDESQTNILQNINVYELEENVTKLFDINSKVKHGTKRISQGIPVFDGTSDSLSFNFTREFGEKYLGITLDDCKDIKTYLDKYPGIYLEADEPMGEGGRINLFNFQLQFNSTYYYLNANYATLEFSAEYEGKRKDTSFFFLFGLDDFYNIDSLVVNGAKIFNEYCLNLSHQETREQAGPAGEKMRVEGGGGLKPVIKATNIRDMLRTEIGKHGNPDMAIINKATIVLPFEFPDDYKYMRQYPQILSPTCRIFSSLKDEETGDTRNTYSYASLTDANSDSSDKGNVNRSLCQYAPDITYHAQEILRIDPNEEDLSKHDIWFLVLSNETYESNDTGSGDSSLSDYYTNLMYAQYYNNMMYGGYGGYGYGGYGYGSYGGYGGYGYGSNYYSYYLMNQMYSSMYSQSQNTSESETQLDIYRYYDATLCGPEYEDEHRRPVFKFTYSIPKE